MKVTIVQGSEVFLYLFDDGIDDYKLLGCASGVSMEKTTEQIEVSTFDSGKYREYIPGGLENVTLSFEGVITLDENPVVQYDELLDLQGAEQTLKLVFTNAFGDELFYVIRVLITRVSMSASEDDFAGYTLQCVRSGNWVKTKTYNNILTDSLGQPVKDSEGHFIRIQ